jgi:hypothetical protein
MHTYFLVAMICTTNIPAECKQIWEKGPYANFWECQKHAIIMASPDQYKITCWFKREGT